MENQDQLGITHGLPADEYFAIPALSNSAMKDLAVSPMRYWHLHINPERPVREESAAMKLGSALHCSVLERAEVFDSRYACAIDPADYAVLLDSISDIREWITSKGGKSKGTRKDEVIQQALGLMDDLGERVPILQEEQRKFAAANEGKVILTPEEWRKVTGMTRALRNEPAIQKILSAGDPEVAMVAKDPNSGVTLKARADWMSDGLIFDVKTFTQTRGSAIDKSVADAIWYEGYHKQAWLYSHIRRLIDGKKSRFIFGFVESSEPYEVRIKELRDDGNNYWNIARFENERLMRLYALCRDTFGDKPWRTAQDVEILIDDEIRQANWS